MNTGQTASQAPQVTQDHSTSSVMRPPTKGLSSWALHRTSTMGLSSSVGWIAPRVSRQQEAMALANSCL